MTHHQDETQTKKEMQRKNTLDYEINYTGDISNKAVMVHKKVNQRAVPAELVRS